MIDPRRLDTADLIRHGLRQFRAERRQRFIHAAGRGIHTHTPGEKVLHLPNGSTVKVTTCDADSTTQVEEDEHLHAVVRPAPHRLTPEEINMLDRYIRTQHPEVNR
jgi:hypothetical protein